MQTHPYSALTHPSSQVLAGTNRRASLIAGVGDIMAAAGEGGEADAMAMAVCAGVLLSHACTLTKHPNCAHVSVDWETPT